MSINSLTHSDTVNRKQVKCIAESKTTTLKKQMEARRKTEDLKLSPEMSLDEFEKAFKKYS